MVLVNSVSTVLIMGNGLLDTAQTFFFAFYINYSKIQMLPKDINGSFLVTLILNLCFTGVYDPVTFILVHSLTSKYLSHTMKDCITMVP